MNQERQIPLTAAEISNLWATYMNDSMAICILKVFLSKVQDQEIGACLEQALQISSKHIQYIASVFKQESFAVPQGFGENDYNQNASALFFDSFYLHYLKQMGRVGITAYGLGLSLSARKDIRDFFNQCLTESVDLDFQVTTTLQSKGLYVRAPFVNGPKEVEFVQNPNFINGLLSEKRTLLAVEITHLYGNIQTCSLIRSLMIGFSQVTKSKELTKLFLRFRNLASEHSEKMAEKLNQSQLKSPMTWNDTVTDSQESPFSDKLMTFHANAVMAVSIGDYGAALSASLRKDIAVMYGGYLVETGLHVNDGAQIMIKNGWMEQPPMALDRDKFATENIMHD